MARATLTTRRIACAGGGDLGGAGLLRRGTRGEDPLRRRRVVARDARRHAISAEGELAFGPGMLGAVGVHHLIEALVGGPVGGELERAVGLTAHGRDAPLRGRVQVDVRHGLVDEVEIHKLAERLEQRRVLVDKVVVVDDEELVAGPVRAPPLDAMLVHADHHVQRRRVDPLRMLGHVRPEVLHAVVRILQVAVLHPHLNLRRRVGGEHPGVGAGEPVVVVPRQHPTRRLAQRGNQADLRLQVVRHEGAKEDRRPSVGQ
eukprot:scaffold53714_cov55-Phaeocystis_antarctica.AAC.2